MLRDLATSTTPKKTDYLLTHSFYNVETKVNIYSKQ